MIGFLVAWALTRTQLPGVAWLERLMQLPYYMTPLVGALAWSILATERAGIWKSGVTTANSKTYVKLTPNLATRSELSQKIVEKC